MSKKPTHFWLDFFACFLIPAYTLLFAGSMQWFGTNFSVIAVTGPDHYRGFVYWGLLAGGYFFVVLNKLAFVLSGLWARVCVRLLAAGAALSLAYALAIPYLPQYFPKYAALHVVLAAGASVLLMLALLLIILLLRRRDPARWTMPMRSWWLIAAIRACCKGASSNVGECLQNFLPWSSRLQQRQTVRILPLLRMCHTQRR